MGAGQEQAKTSRAWRCLARPPGELGPEGQGEMGTEGMAEGEDRDTVGREGEDLLGEKDPASVLQFVVCASQWLPALPRPCRLLSLSPSTPTILLVVSL